MKTTRVPNQKTEKVAYAVTHMSWDDWSSTTPKKIEVCNLMTETELRDAIARSGSEWIVRCIRLGEEVQIKHEIIL